ncbi:MAG: CHASE3 domain-containing protein [Salinivirgaceae bacterium]|nr:CHASE3 domain-containing protein [Salinivirgaceae bacterium]
MKKLTIGYKIAIGFAIILSMFVIVSVITLRNQNNLAENADWVTHTHQVITVIEGISGSLKDAETGQRGYIITGVDEYLEPYKDALKSIDSELVELKQLTSDNAEMQQNIIELKGLINKKLEELDQTINLRKNKGFQTAQEVVITNHGKIVMDQIRGVLNEMTSIYSGGYFSAIFKLKQDLLQGA